MLQSHRQSPPQIDSARVSPFYTESNADLVVCLAVSDSLELWLRYFRCGGKHSGVETSSTHYGRVTQSQSGSNST